jgi:hypothetical protein
MRPRAHTIALSGILLLGAEVLGLPSFAFGQTADKDKQSTEGPKKPTRKMEFVTTTDSVAALAVRRGPQIPETPALQPKVDASEEISVPADETAKRAAEIALTEKLIKEKQQRIALLLRLFATDEQMFLRDPSAAEKDPGVKERRKYSQDELLWETAELAKLKTRLNELKAEK